MSTRAVNLYFSEYDVYGARPKNKDPRSCTPGEHGFLGNPFVIGVDGSRARVILLHKLYFLERVDSDKAFREAVLALEGKSLGCMCKPQHCHLDTVVDWINKHGRYSTSTGCFSAGRERVSSDPQPSLTQRPVN